ncbi:MAG: hypothetical protein ACRDHN_15710 [Thermomicrobiales bacterium]
MRSIGFKRCIRLAAVAFMFATMVPVAGVSAEASSGELDLPAALLAPDDAAEVGFEDYGIWAGWSVSAEERTRELISPGLDEPEARAEIEDFGVRMTYFQSLLPIGDQSMDGWEPTITIQTILEEFDSPSSARGGFDLAAESPEYEGAEFYDDAPEYGDESLVVRFEIEPGADDRTDYPVQVTNVVFRIENVVATVILTGIDRDVAIEDVQALAGIAEEKVLGVIDGEDVGRAPAPDLTHFIPQYDQNGMCVCRTQYTIYDGAARPFALAPDESDALQTMADEYGIEAQYLTVIKPAEEVPSGVAMIVRVNSFDSDSAAEDYVQDAVDWIEWGSNQYSDTEAIDAEGLERVGDSYAAFSFVTEGEETHAHTSGEVDEFAGIKVLVQIDTVVYEIDLFGVDAPEIETLAVMANDLIDCSTGGCNLWVGFPAEVEDYLAEQAELAA